MDFIGELSGVEQLLGRCASLQLCVQHWSTAVKHHSALARSGRICLPFTIMKIGFVCDEGRIRAATQPLRAMGTSNSKSRTWPSATRFSAPPLYHPPQFLPVLPSYFQCGCVRCAKTVSVSTARMAPFGGVRKSSSGASGIAATNAGGWSSASSREGASAGARQATAFNATRTFPQFTPALSSSPEPVDSITTFTGLRSGRHATLRLLTPSFRAAIRRLSSVRANRIIGVYGAGDGNRTEGRFNSQ